MGVVPIADDVVVAYDAAIGDKAEVMGRGGIVIVEDCIGVGKRIVGTFGFGVDDGNRRERINAVFRAPSEAFPLVKLQIYQSFTTTKQCSTP